MPKHKFTISEFIDAARKIHGEKYCYSLLTNTRLSSKLDFICPIHGPFNQYGCHHLNGAGCKKCGITKRSGRKSYTKEMICKKHGPYTISEKRFASGNYICDKCYKTEISAYREYRRKVRVLSERWCREKPYFIDPNFFDKPRGHKQYHLDHIYSVKSGYENNVPPEIISHWSNLMLIPYRHNLAKKDTNWRSLEYLFEQYHDCIKEFGF